MKITKMSILIAIGIISGFIGGILSGNISGSYADTSSQIETVTASAFILKDENGVERGGIKFENGEPVIYLAKDKKASFYVGLVSGTPLLGMRDDNGTSRVLLGLDSSGDFSLKLATDQGKPGIVLLQTNDGTPLFSLCDPDGKPAVVIGAKTDKTILCLLDKNKKPNLILQDRMDKGTLLTFNSHEKAPYMSMGVMEGTPHFMFNQGHRTGGMLGYATNGQPFMSLRENGSITWIEPRGAKPGGGAWDNEIDWSDMMGDVMR